MIMEDYDFNDNGRMADRMAYAVLAFVLALLVCALLGSCRARGAVVVPEVRQTVVHQRDTVTVKDSVRESSTTIIQQADSALMAQFGIRLESMERAWLVRQTDSKATVSNANTVVRKDSVVHDSIPVPYPIEVYKDKEPGAWQQIMTQLGYGFFGIIIGAVVLALWKYKRKE